MSIEEAIEILEQHNRWRRDSEGIYEMQDPKQLGFAIDTLVNFAKQFSIKDDNGNLLNAGDWLEIHGFVVGLYELIIENSEWVLYDLKGNRWGKFSRAKELGWKIYKK
jgi:hypothetical protein